MTTVLRPVYWLRRDFCESSNPFSQCGYTRSVVQVSAIAPNGTSINHIVWEGEGGLGLEFLQRERDGDSEKWEGGGGHVSAVCPLGL